jgi:hypothetical protein
MLCDAGNHLHCWNPPLQQGSLTYSVNTKRNESLPQTLLCGSRPRYVKQPLSPVSIRRAGIGMLWGAGVPYAAQHQVPAHPMVALVTLTNSPQSIHSWIDKATRATWRPTWDGV